MEKFKQAATLGGGKPLYRQRDGKEGACGGAVPMRRFGGERRRQGAVANAGVKVNTSPLRARQGGFYYAERRMVALDRGMNFTALAEKGSPSEPRSC